MLSLGRKYSGKAARANAGETWSSTDALFAAPTAHWACYILVHSVFTCLFSRPYPPRELFGPKVGRSKCGMTPWGAFGLPLGPSRALLGSPWAPPRGPCVHYTPPKTCRQLLVDLPTSVLFTPFVPRRTFSLNYPSRNMLKMKYFYCF